MLMPRWTRKYKDSRYYKDLKALYRWSPWSFYLKRTSVELRLPEHMQSRQKEQLQAYADKNIVKGKRVMYHSVFVCFFFDDILITERLFRRIVQISDDIEQHLGCTLDSSIDGTRHITERQRRRELIEIIEEKKEDLKRLRSAIDESGVLWLHDYPVEEAQLMQLETSRLSDLLHYDFSIRFEYFVGDSDDDDENDKITKEFVKAVRAETNCIVKNRYGLVVITTPAQRLQKETFLDAKKQLDEIAERYDGGEDGWTLLRKKTPKKKGDKK